MKDTSNTDSFVLDSDSGMGDEGGAELQPSSLDELDLDSAGLGLEVEPEKKTEPEKKADPKKEADKADDKETKTGEEDDEWLTDKDKDKSGKTDEGNAETESIKPFASDLFTKVGEKLGDPNFKFQDDFLKADTYEGLVDTIAEMIIENSKPVFDNAEAERFYNFIADGGDPSKYHQAYYAPVVDTTKLDITKPDDQKAILREYYRRTSQMEPDEVNEVIGTYEVQEKLEAKAKLAKERVDKLIEKEQTDLVDNQKKAVEQQKQQAEAYITNVNTLIDKSTDKELGYKLTDKQKEQFKDYIWKRGNDGLTEQQRRARKDPYYNLRIQAAGFLGIDETVITKKAESQGAKMTANKLNNMTQTGAKVGTRQSGTGAASAKTNLDDFIL